MCVGGQWGGGNGVGCVPRGQHRGIPWSPLGLPFPTVGCTPEGSFPVPTTPFECEPAPPSNTPGNGQVRESSGLFHQICTETQSPFLSVRIAQPRVRKASFLEGFLSREILILLGLCGADFRLEMASGLG